MSNRSADAVKKVKDIPQRGSTASAVRSWTLMPNIEKKSSASAVRSVVEYDQYVNYMTDPIPQSREFIVSVLFIKDGEVRQQEFEGVKSVDVFNQQSLPSI